MQHWKKTLSALIFIAILLWLFLFFGEREVNYNPTPYEKNLMSYFKEIALKSEYDGNPERLIKWKEPMVLFIKKEEEFKNQMLFIEKTIDEINRLAIDGFKIVLTNDLSKSNSVLFLCSKDRVAELDLGFYKIITDDINYEISGLAYSEFSTENYIIDKSLIFINSEEPIHIQESTILEEITQSIGLAYDSDLYPNSIFYQKKHEQDTTIMEYSELDKDIVRLLYHSKMKAGLDSIGVDRVIKSILKSEKK